MKSSKNSYRSVRRLGRFIKSQLTVPLSYRFGQARLYPSARGEDDFLFRHFETACSEPQTRTLDLGCAGNIRNPFHAKELFGIDIRKDLEKNIVAADLSINAIPFPDAYFNYITAFDFIEHVPRVVCSDKTRFPFVELMTEINRTLKDGGMFFSRTPAYPSKQAFQDPTHVNIITEDTFPEYFCGKEAGAGAYGFQGKFALVGQEWNRCWLLTLMKKHL